MVGNFSDFKRSLMSGPGGDKFISVKKTVTSRAFHEGDDKKRRNFPPIPLEMLTSRNVLRLVVTLFYRAKSEETFCSM